MSGVATRDAEEVRQLNVGVQHFAAVITHTAVPKLTKRPMSEFDKASEPRTAGGAYTFTFPDGTARTYDPAEVEKGLDAALPGWRENVNELVKVNRPLPPGTPDSLRTKREVRSHECLEAMRDATVRTFDLPAPGTEYDLDNPRWLWVEVLAGFLSFTA